MDHIKTRGRADILLFAAQPIGLFTTITLSDSNVMILAS